MTRMKGPPCAGFFLGVPDLAWVHNGLMHNTPAVTRRAYAIQRLKERLAAQSFPRVQMTLIVALTGGFGLLASFSLLHLGVDAMAIRYPLALLCAYGFFLLLIWFWLRQNASDYADVPDLSCIPGGDGGGMCQAPLESGGGGDFGGGGASGTYDASASVMDNTVSSPLKSVGDSVASVAESDELAIPLIVIALALGLALASLYVVYIAPVLFAEVLVDGVLSYALFRHLRRENSPHWLSSAFRRTWLPFAITAFFLMAVGSAMEIYAPGAHSVGQVLEYASNHSSSN